LKRVVSGDTIQTPNPSLSFYFTPPHLDAKKHKLCWNYTLTNSIDDAYNVFIAPQQVSYLSNWTIEDSTGTVLLTPVSGIFQYSNHLSSTYSVSEYLCAVYDSCYGADTIPVSYGWNCNGYPPPLDTTLCYVNSTSINFSDASFDPSLVQDEPDTIDLCDPFFIRAEVHNSAAGSIYPFQLYLTGLNSSLIVDSVQFTSCLLHDTATIIGSPPYYITDSILNSIGITEDSTISYGGTGNCFIALLYMRAGCAAAQNAGDTIDLPHIHVMANTFCDSTIDMEERIIHSVPLQFQSIYSGVSHCTDCFTITKTASPTTVAPGDTVTFTIQVCANNGSPQHVNLAEFLPLSFDTISVGLPPSDTIPANGCNTYTVTGFFHSPGSCAINVNSVQLISDNGFDTLYASACVTVMDTCAAIADSTIADSTFSTSYGSGMNNVIVFIAGTFYVDSVFTFTNCTVYTNAGAQIIVMPAASLTLDSTVITGCSEMWRGITLLPNAKKLAVVNHSMVRDADKGIDAHTKTYFYVSRSSIIDCVKGIYIEPNAGWNSITGIVTESEFGLVAPAFKPDYSGQNMHGTVPATGIEINDMPFLSIGMAAGQPNEFHDMNRGITGFRSSFIVSNSQFWNISADTFYHKPYEGTAIVSVGDKSIPKQASLEVDPVTSGANTIFDSHRGIYTDYSKLLATKLKIINVSTGVYSSRCMDNLTALVTECTIDAFRRGIRFINNPGTGGMFAKNNTIFIHSAKSIGISMEEPSASMSAYYEASCNFIDATNSDAGIYASALTKAVISQDTVHLVRTVTLPVSPQGISLNGCTDSKVLYNSVEGNSVTDTTMIGIGVDISDGSIVTCNVVDSTGWGFFFGSSCLTTNFRGNYMYDHWEGLRLNNVAVIDTQTHAGNRWLGSYGSGFGAVNMNDTPLVNVQYSLFIVALPLGPTYFPITPIINPNNTGWFQDFPGTPFSCPTVTACSKADLDDDDKGSKKLMKLIAKDSSLTSEFIEETKNIARTDLYSKLKQDSTSYSGDAVLMQFKQNSDTGTTGRLYEVKNTINTISVIDSTTLSQIATTDSSIAVNTESLRVLDSIYAADTSIDISIPHENLIAGLNTLEQTRADLIAPYQSAEPINLTQSIAINNTASAIQLPEQNEQMLNQIVALFYLYGMDTLDAYYSQVESIAVQCPYAGGKAVYRARTFMEMLNDTMDYDDRTTCAQSGIFRKPTVQSTALTHSIKIIPNPANDKIEIVLLGQYEGICNLVLRNAIGEEIYSSSLDCKKKSTYISVSNYSPGVYYVQVFVNHLPLKVEKLIIVK
jgi:uncharacterized repeat protein (TIGR01451 family)